MPSIINATTTTGLVSSADNSGSLQLATNNGTTAVTIDTSQNVGIGTSSPAAKLQAVGTDGTAGGTNTLLRLLGNIGGTNKSGGLFFRTLNSTTVGTERIALIQSTDVDNNNRVLALNSAGGNVLIGTTTDNASGGVLQVSNGITFPATQSASSDANTLDDYEEGTWTPNVRNAGQTSTFTVIIGRYVKIGRQVTCWCSVDGGVTGAATGNLTISGLPFVYENSGNWLNFGQWNGSGSFPNGAIVSISSTSEVYGWSGGGYVTEIKSFFTCAFTYRATS
jgi:hypothetical protein